MEGVTSTQECLQQLTKTADELSDKTEDISVSQSIASSTNESGRYTIPGDQKDATEATGSSYVEDNPGPLDDEKKSDPIDNSAVESSLPTMCDKSESSSTVCGPTQSDNDSERQLESKTSIGEVTCSDSEISEHTQPSCEETDCPPSTSDFSEEVSEREETTTDTTKINEETTECRTEMDKAIEPEDECDTDADMQLKDSSKVETSASNQLSETVNRLELKDDQADTHGESDVCDKFEERKETSSTEYSEKLTMRGDEDVLVREDEPVSRKEDEDVSMREDEDISVRDEDVSMRQDEDVSMRQDEDVSMREDEDIEASKPESENLAGLGTEDPNHPTCSEEVTDADEMLENPDEKLKVSSESDKNLCQKETISLAEDEEPNSDQQGISADRPEGNEYKNFDDKEKDDEHKSHDADIDKAEADKDKENQEDKVSSEDKEEIDEDNTEVDAEKQVDTDKQLLDNDNQEVDAVKQVVDDDNQELDANKQAADKDTQEEDSSKPEETQDKQEAISKEKDTVDPGEACLDTDSVSLPSQDSSLIDKGRTEDSAHEQTTTPDISEKESDNVLSQDKDAHHQDENVDEDNEKDTAFTQVNVEKDTLQEKDVKIVETEDPIGGDLDLHTSGPEAEQTVVGHEQEQGADEEICIIPDTERIISQAEKDAASALPTLRDLSEASASIEGDPTCSTKDSSVTSSQKYVVNKFDQEGTFTCAQCLLDRKVNFRLTKGDATTYICDDSCLEAFKSNHPDGVVHTNEGEIRVKNLSTCTEPPSVSFIRKCAACGNKTDKPDTNLAWEIMDFCNEYCLSKYQREIGSKCSSCNIDVRANSLGKYCVRFGNDIRQFCTSHCLEEYKKGLKVCSYCQQDISKGSEGFLAPVGDKGHFKDFCSQLCMEKYDIMTNDRVPKVDPGTKCCVCHKTDITIEFEWNAQNNYFCSEPCFVAFSFVNQITAGKCAMCRRNFPRQTLEQHTMFYDNIQHSFCSNSCQNIYIIAHRKIVPCNWCKVKKYNFDMIRRYSTNNEVLNMCSVNCYSLYLVSVNAVQAKKIKCDFCLKTVQSMYHLTMSDATIRNFCSYSCVMSFQRQFPKAPIKMANTNRVPIPIPVDIPRKSKRLSQTGRQEDETGMPVISNVQSLATTNGTVSPVSISTRSTRSKSTVTSNGQPVDAETLNIPMQIKQQIVVKPYPIPEQRNVGTLVRTRCFTKGTQFTKQTSTKEIQTEKRAKDKILIPVPVPIYVPSPMHMYATAVPVPIPIPIPIPVPIFIPTTRNSANGIMKEIKKIQVKIPSDPYEAELLMMAEMVADDKKEENTDSESDIDDTAGGDDGHFSPEPVDASNTFGDDMLQMALKMATELDEPAVDLEGALTANTITAPQGEATSEEHVDESQPLHLMDRQAQAMRGRKRGMRQGRHHTASKRGRRVSGQGDMPLMTPTQPPAPPEPVEKPDANMCLKYTFGVNAWKQWVTTKNCELEKSSRRVKLFKTEILQLTADELNYSLCLFVKEVRKPNGAEYAPDTIYYLCLGIQQYLFENGRIDNIFCDPYYEKFTDCLDEVARKFSVLYNDSHYIVTRVEEEHLWESKQLGAHSPHVLLSTLMFFNTKHFNLTTVDEHMQLSFSHIMKHWKRNPNQPGASKVPGSRNVLLRFYPPQSAIQNNARKKKVYEQQENEDNPLRCPVKLYEFYLSKCPESVKTRNDVFYLQPERSCVPDSPVWYSTMPLPREALEKMLHRVKMVKEINVALLTS